MKKFKEVLTHPLFILLLIVIIGAALRLYQLGKDSLWLDCAYTAVISVDSFSNIMKYYALDTHPPLYYLLEHISIVLQQSISEFSLRIMSAIIGILTIPVFYLIGKEASNETTGLLMAAMVCLSQFAIHYSREARMYALVLLFCSLAFWCWLRYRKDIQWYHLLGFSVFSALAIWSQFMAVLPFIILCLFLPRWLDRIESFLITIILCLPLALPAMQMAQHQLSLTMTGLIGMDVVNSVVWYLTGFNPVGFLLLGTLAIVGAYSLWKRDKHLALTCITMITSCVAFGVITSYVGVHEEARYYIFLLPAFFLLVSEVPMAVLDEKC